MHGSPERRPRVVLTIGKFDGVHAGHRHLAAQVMALAGELDAAGAALILHPHPASVLAGRRIQLLSTVRQRRARLHGLGLDIAEPLRFTPEVAELSPEAFLDRLQQRFRIAAIVVGPDFAFGQARAADVSDLRHLARDRGFELRVVQPLVVDGERVSSRGIRQRLLDGDIRATRRLLRQPPRLTGTVVHGAARGRELGFPTANLDLREDFVVPGNGIYAVRATWEGAQGPSGSRWIDGVASIGVRPTFDNGPRSIEVFLLDFSGDLYGRQLDVAFIAHQRGEQRFERIEALIEQMHADVAIARRILAAERAPAWQVVESPQGPLAHLRGFDLAAICEAAADCLPALREGRSAVASNEATWPDTLRPAEASPRNCRLLAAGDAGLAGAPERLLSAWIDALDGARSAHVFQAGNGTVQALACGFSSAGTAPSIPAHLLEGPRQGADGWLNATLGIAEPGA